MIPVSAPPRVRERLREAADGPVRVLHRGRHAVYLDVDGWCVGVVGTAAAAVPCALRLPTPDLGALTGAAAYLGDGVLVLDGTPLRVGRVVAVQTPRTGGQRIPGTTADSATSLADPLATVAEFVRRCGLSGRSPRVTPEVVTRLVGRGDGLTPLGDDVLCGWLALHRAAGVDTPDVDAAVAAAAPRTTLLSATLLDCAAHGEVLPEFAAYVAALGTAGEHDAAARLSAVGHTSGAGLLVGARLALAELRSAAEVAA